jgi:hypothetical protein
MFIQYFGQVELPLDEVEALLPDVLSRVGGLSEGSYRAGEALRARVDVGPQRSLVAKTVTLEVGEPARGNAAIRVPLTWEATGTPGLFPVMRADLVMARLGNQVTQVKFEGSYDPPLGSIGQLLDRAVLHRVSELSVKSLVDQIIAMLAAGPRSTSTPGTAA